MSLSPFKPTWDLWGAALVSIIALCVYAIGLGASDLVGDPLKYALNVAYPHPPYFRGLMWVSQTLFGATPFWARLPIVAISACAVGMVWMLFRFVQVHRVPAAVLTAGFALCPLWSVVVRDGYLGPALAACWLLAIVGVAAMEREQRYAGWLLIAVAFVAGLWGQIQNLWLVPALLVAAWVKRAHWHKVNGWERTILILIGLQMVLWGGYLLTNPLIVGDILFFVNDRAVNKWLAPGWPFVTIALVIFGMVGYRWVVRKQVPWEAWEWASGTLCLTVTPLVLYNPVAWYGPYLWACLVVITASVLRAAPRAAKLPLVILAACALAIGGWHAWDVTQPDRADVDAVREQLKDVDHVIILGAHGYEWNYAFPHVTFRRLPENRTIRAQATHAIAPHAATVTAEENAWLAQQTPLGVADDLLIYAITNP